MSSRYVERLLLVLILLLALFLRLYGLGFSLPLTIHPDEPNVVDHAVATIKTGDWNPHWFIYPSGYHYFQVGVLSLHLLWGIARGIYGGPADLPDSSHVITAAPAAYLWARGTTALFGVLTVFLVYLLGRRLSSPAAGLVGALLLAVSPLHAEHSHYVTTDVPTAALTLLAVFLAVEVLERGGLGRGFLAGLVVGLAGGFKYNAVVALLPLLLAIGLRAAHREAAARRAALSLLALALLGVVVGYMAACPYTLADLPTFLDDLGYETHIYRFGGEAGVIRVYEVGNLRLPPWMAYAHYLGEENLPAALAYLGGVVLVLVRRRRPELVLLSFVAGYYLFLSSYASIFVRNVLPAMPALAVLGGIFLAEGAAWLVERRPWKGPLSRLPGMLLERSRSGPRRVTPFAWVAGGLLRSLDKVLLLLVALAICWTPARGVYGADRYLAIPTSEVQARSWLDAHVSPGEKVAAELHPLLFLRTSYHVTPVDYLSNYPLEALVNLGYAYVVANSERYGPEFALQDTFPDYYLPLLDQLERVADFPGHTQKLPGPRLTIFRLPGGGPRPQRGLDAVAGPGLRLLGLDVGRRQGEGELSYVRAADDMRAGEPLALALYMRADAALPEDYTALLRLRAADGRIVAAVEAVPCGGACPTSGWVPGQVVVVNADMSLAPVLPAGTYRLELQLLRPGARQPLPFTPAGPEPDTLTLAAIALLEP